MQQVPTWLRRIYAFGSCAGREHLREIERVIVVALLTVGCMHSYVALAQNSVPATAGPVWYCMDGGFSNGVVITPSPQGCFSLTDPNAWTEGYMDSPVQIMNADVAQLATATYGPQCTFMILSNAPSAGKWNPGSYTWYNGGTNFGASTQFLGTSSKPTGGNCLSGLNLQLATTVFRQFTCQPTYSLGFDSLLGTGFCSGGTGVGFLDPVADGLVLNNAIVTSIGHAAQLAAASHQVFGASADNATQVLVRVQGVNAGDQIKLTLADENGPSSDGLGAGYVTDLAGAGMDSRNSAGVITVTAVSTSSTTAMAFAAYHVPTDFVRSGNSSDPKGVKRNLTVTAVDMAISGSSTSQPLTIVRPPIVLVHGLWGSNSDFSSSDVYSTLVNSGVFDIANAITIAQYDNPVAIASSVPSYSTTPLAASGNSLGFMYAATQILPQIQKAMADYKMLNPAGNPIAAVQADLVVHSMGGAATRTLPQVAGFIDQANYGYGYVHKLITLDTPHNGTPLAAAILLTSNTCVRNMLALMGRVSFTSAVVNAQSFSGAVGDLNPASSALRAIHLGNSVIPTAMIGGQMTSTQQAAGGQGAKASFLTTFCAGAPLATALTNGAPGWPGLMQSSNDQIAGGVSDGIVPLTSQFDNEGAYFDANPANTKQAIHSAGTEALGFLPPTIFDQATGVPALVLSLLNTPVSNATVFEMKP